ncbi:hypothetical protein [Noviherbaspirillum sp. Root189]|uniref:hypothetical protein n=1 Tax=Noviherbaspirillum sp. Root189 TaxID=1736487 RepID=UPI0012E3CFEA|nr:hypothetical protein [Noviherbaspirillum sp. Root189]
MIFTSKREDSLALFQFQCANQSWLTLRAVLPESFSRHYASMVDENDKLQDTR